MRLVGWGTLWGVGVVVLPFVGTAAIGIMYDPNGLGYLLFSLPVVALVGAVLGVLGGLLALLVARTVDQPAVAVLVFLGAFATACTALFLLVVDARDRLAQAPVIPLLTVVATGLAAWGMARDRRRRTIPTPARW